MWLVKLVLALHVTIYRLTGGRFGGRMNGEDILLLTTLGRKSGTKRTRPLVYLRDKNHYLVAAGAAGSDKHPGWYWNAAKGSHPVTIQVMDKVMTVDVVDVEGDQREEFYRRFRESAHYFETYQQKTDREIPVLILTPQAEP